MVDEPVTLELLGARTPAMSAEPRDMQQRVGSLEARFGALESRVTALSVAMETRLEAIERRIGGVEEWMHRQLDPLVRMAARMGVESQAA